MDNDEFHAYLKGNKFEELLNSFDPVICQYYDENDFISENRNGDGFLNIFSMNIRSLPKHGGELANFISSMETKFDVIILTEIGARNLSVVLNLFPAYTFHYVRPQNNNCGGAQFIVECCYDGRPGVNKVMWLFKMWIREPLYWICV